MVMCGQEVEGNEDANKKRKKNRIVKVEKVGKRNTIEIVLRLRCNLDERQH